MKNNRFVISLIILLLNLPFLYGEINYFPSSGDAGLPGEYLFGFPSSVRALGIGRAYNAISFDSGGICWNPAGVVFLNRSELTASYAAFAGETKSTFLGYAYPFWKNNVVTISRISLEMGGLEQTDIFGQHQGNFDVSNSVYYLGYARKLTSKLALGTNLKIVLQNIGINSGQGYGIDVGTIYNVYDNIYLGGSLQNIIPPTIKMSNVSESFPLGIKAGAAWKHKIKNDSLLVATDINLPNLFPVSNNFQNGKTYLPVRWHIGTEYSFRDVLALRTGINYKEISFGIGLAMKSILFDYALVLQPLDVFHQFGLTYRFGLTREEEIEFNKAKKYIEIEQRCSKAEESFSKQDYAAAIKESKLVLELDPENRKAESLLNKIDLINKTARAKQLYVEALENLSKGNEVDGKKQLAEALILAPEQGKQLETEIYQKALSFQTVGDFVASRKELIKVLTLNPGNNDAREMLKRIEVILQSTPE